MWCFLSLCLENIHSQGVRASVCIPFVLGTFLRYPSYTHTKTKRVNSGILNHSTQGLRECVCVCVGQWRQPWLCRKEWGQSWKFEWVQERKEGRVGFLKCHFFSLSCSLSRVFVVGLSHYGTDIMQMVALFLECCGGLIGNRLFPWWPGSSNISLWHNTHFKWQNEAVLIGKLSNGRVS